VLGAWIKGTLCITVLNKYKHLLLGDVLQIIVLNTNNNHNKATVLLKACFKAHDIGL